MSSVPFSSFLLFCKDLSDFISNGEYILKLIGGVGGRLHGRGGLLNPPHPEADRRCNPVIFRTCLWEAAAPASGAVAVLAEMSVRNFWMNLCSLSRRERARFSKKTGGCVIVAVFSGLFLKAGHLGIFSPAIFLLGSFLLQQKFFFFGRP